MVKDLELIIKRQNPNIFEYYNMGLDTTIVRHSFSDLNFNPPKSVVDWYSWYNGLNRWDLPTGLTSIFSYGVFAPLDIAIKGYHEAIKLELCLPKFFPILVDDDILIDLDNQSATFGSLFIRAPGLGIVIPKRIYSSMEIFIETHFECYKQGAIIFNREGNRRIDFKKQRIISKRLNPECEYWLES